MPARANKAELAARVPVPVSAVWIAVLAHCAGNRISSQSGNAPGSAEAVKRIAASPATTNIAIHQPFSPAERENRVPRAAKLKLATITASPVENGCGRGGMPSARANRIRPAPVSRARRTPIQRRPAAAAAIMPTPIRPTASIGPPVKASGAGAGASASVSMATVGAATPASANGHQGFTVGPEFAKYLDIFGVAQATLDQAQVALTDFFDVGQWRTVKFNEFDQVEKTLVNIKKRHVAAETTGQ